MKLPFRIEQVETYLLYQPPNSHSELISVDSASGIAEDRVKKFSE